MIPFLNIVCYKWGSRYDAEEVNILHASVKRNLSVPHRFHCLTNDGAGLSPEIVVWPLPANAMIGNGPKIYTFSHGFLGLGPHDHVVSLDIDIVVVDSLDFLAADPHKDFVIARHRASRSNSRGHGAVYRVSVGSHRYLWDRFIADPARWSQLLPGKKDNPFSEQRWLEYNFSTQPMQFFPHNKVLIFRTDCFARSPTYVLGRQAARLGLTTARFGKARLPNIGEAVVSFSGETKPRNVRDGHHGHLKQAPFVARYWHL